MVSLFRFFFLNLAALPVALGIAIGANALVVDVLGPATLAAIFPWPLVIGEYALALGFVWTVSEAIPA